MRLSNPLKAKHDEASIRRWSRFFPMFIVASLVLLPAQAQTVKVVQVYKNIAYVQTNNAAVIVDPTPITADYGGPYGFQADEIGTNLSGITPPALTLPSGSLFNDPAQFNGHLTYAGQELSVAGFEDEWSFGPNDWGGASQSTMDADFVGGAYQFVVQGKSVSLSLSGNSYPNAPSATLTGGSWIDGNYVLDPANPLNITTSTFSDYGNKMDGRIFVYANGTLTISYHSTSRWPTR
jgi:hypothetical protein